MPIQISLDYPHGSQQTATSTQDFEKLQAECAAALQDLKANPMGYMEIIDDGQHIQALQELAKTYENRDIQHLIVLGIGGSALGLRTIQDSLSSQLKKKIDLRILDNVDPFSVEAHLSEINLSKSLIIVISKSGSTAETISQFLIFRAACEKAIGDSWPEHFAFITDPKIGPLRALSDEYSIPSLEVPGNVGGRFSVLTAVGLLPAAILGHDIEALLAGARSMRDHSLNQKDAAVSRWVTQHMLLSREGASVQVLMNYCDRLKTFGDWFCQLWGESLGKKHDLSGAVVHTGSTPLTAVGATDQHSVVQLFVEGPKDKQFLILGVDNHQAQGKLPAKAEAIHEDFAYLSGTSLAELFEAEREGTCRALRSEDRSVCEIQLDEVNAHNLGALFMFFELATSLAGSLYGINPYDQPGVEAGKIAAFALMNRQGYAEKAKEFFGENEFQATKEILLPE